MYLLTIAFEAPGSDDLPTDEWIGAVSGLNIGAPSPSDGQIQMLVEYLTGEEGGPNDHVSAAQISRLFILGDSMAPMLVTGKGEADAEGEIKKSVRSGIIIIDARVLLNGAVAEIRIRRNDILIASYSDLFQPSS